jgi:hypothetical protein
MNVFEREDLLRKYTIPGESNEVLDTDLVRAILMVEYCKREPIPGGVAFIHPHSGNRREIWEENGEIKTNGPRRCREIAVKLVAGYKFTATKRFIEDYGPRIVESHMNGWRPKEEFQHERLAYYRKERDLARKPA